MTEYVWANALLSDGKILFWWTGSECKSIYDFNKDFYFAKINMTTYKKEHKLEIKKKRFRQETTEDNNKIFYELAPDFYRQFEISPDSKGQKPY